MVDDDGLHNDHHHEQGVLRLGGDGYLSKLSFPPEIISTTSVSVGVFPTMKANSYVPREFLLGKRQADAVKRPSSKGNQAMDLHLARTHGPNGHLGDILSCSQAQKRGIGENANLRKSEWYQLDT